MVALTFDTNMTDGMLAELDRGTVKSFVNEDAIAELGSSVNAIVDQTLRSTKNGSIIVMHLTGGNTAPLTALAIPRIVEGLRGRGLQLVKLSELLAAAP